MYAFRTVHKWRCCWKRICLPRYNDITVWNWVKKISCISETVALWWCRPKSFLSLNPDVDAIVCFNDETAKCLPGSLKNMVFAQAGILRGTRIWWYLGILRDGPASCHYCGRMQLHYVRKRSILLLKCCHPGNMSPRNIVVNTEFILRESASGLINRPLSIKEYQHQRFRDTNICLMIFMQWTNVWMW